MQFYSTANKSERVSLSEAVMQGLAPDGGLYMPVEIPRLPEQFFKDISKKSFQEISFEVASLVLKNDLPEAELRKIVDHTVQFDAPLVQLSENISSLELFHGPTLAFKDFGARFLSGLLGYFARRQDREITILVATSGDTGSAVANGFLNVPGTRVIVLYPSGKVSEIQEKQFTTLGGNITAVEVDGTFDDCQRLVKEAFLDNELKHKLFLTSANSINVARLIPQTFYYFRAFAHIKDPKKPLAISVPSGNFGNLTAGLIAQRMGLPVSQFIAATNANAVVPEYLQTAIFSPRASVQTISNAMDVGNPSNFSRLLDLFDQDFGKLSRQIIGFDFSDDQTRSAMREVNENNNYTLDPHGAVAYLGLKKYLRGHPDMQGIFLETAHPGKFQSVVEEVLREQIVLPERLANFLGRDKKAIRMSSRFDNLREFLGRY
jgi:threonine synthase